MSLTTQPTSTTRILTQNLLISASEAETDKEVWESSVEDLSALINVVALYDDIFILGRATAFDAFVNHSNLMGFLNDEQIIKTQTLDKAASEDISQRAKKHLALYLDVLDNKGRRNIERFEPLLRSALSPSEAFYGLFYGSDH